MILILGGTTEASALARLLSARADLSAMVSLAGRTRNPVLPPIPHRIGGFGGPAKLAGFLSEHGVLAVIDATHPFAERISANAATACRAVGVPLLALRRRPWTRQAQDRWTEVADAAAAVMALGAEPRRVFLTVGRLELAPFLAAPHHHYLVRSVDPPEAMPPLGRLILARGPFDEVAEAALMQEERIDIVVTKNSGGSATYGKIAAARRLGLPVILLTAPDRPDAPSVETAEAALAWIEALDSHAAAQPRGV
jgi:precorrin-6A/cobalt-precorrin-6A reductase